MKNKKIISLLSLVTVSGILVSCSGKEQSLSYIPRASLRADIKEDFIEKGSQVYLKENGELVKINDPDDPTVNVLDELRISAPILSIYYSDSQTTGFEDSATLTVSGFPKKAPMGTITWSSSDPSIAKVDQNGTVTAVSQGLAVVTATSSVGKSVSSKVYVNNTNVLTGQAAKSAAKILERQSDPNFPTPKTIRVDEIYTQSKKRDGNLVSSTKFLQSMWASVDDAYFRIVSDDESIKTNGGSVVPSNTSYVFYTTKDYTSYIFSTSDGKANYMTLDQSSLVDKGLKPFDGLGEVLQSFFVSGSKIMTSQFEDILGKEELGGGYSGNKYRGSFGENSGQFAYRKITSSGGRVGPEEAQELDIPSGTIVEITDDISYLFADNLLQSKIITETLEYEIASVPVVEEISVVYTYHSSDVEIWWPDSAQFLKVDSIFDL